MKRRPQSVRNLAQKNEIEFHGLSLYAGDRFIPIISASFTFTRLKEEGRDVGGLRTRDDTHPHQPRHIVSFTNTWIAKVSA